MSMSGAGGNDAVSLRRNGAVCTVCIDRLEAGNAIDRAVREGLVRAMEEIAADPGIRVTVLTGAGNEAFSVGSDVAQLATLTPLEAEAFAREARRTQEAISRMPKPVVAAIKGPCIGAGLELALHCDMRIARADARFGLPGVTIGLTPGGAAVARLTQIVGSGPALALALTGGIISAERAFMLGLVSNVLSAEQFDDGLEQLVQHLAGLSPLALREIKRLFHAAQDKGPSGAAEAGPEAFARCFQEGEVTQKLRSFYGGPGPGVPVH